MANFKSYLMPASIVGATNVKSARSIGVLNSISPLTRLLKKAFVVRSKSSADTSVFLFSEKKKPTRLVEDKSTLTF